MSERAARVRMFMASSVDGFIAGEGDDLSWLPGPEAGGPDHGFKAFMAEVGAILMGRRTFDVVAGFEGPWPYGETPMLVATRRPLESKVKTARAVGGDIREMVEEAKRTAGGRDVYIDGGALVREAMDAGLVDEITVTFIPVVLGRGIPLFAGVGTRRELRLQKSTTLGGKMVQLTYDVVAK